MPISDFSNSPVVTLSPGHIVMEAIKLMRDQKVGAVVITEKEKPVGILTDRDILLRVTGEGLDAISTKIRSVMTPNPIVISQEKGVWDLIQTMKQHGKRRFPIVDHVGKLVGIMTLDDLIALMGVEMCGLGQAISSDLGYTAYL
ncbi:MAG TPA: CBS domain-containing protein [Nitrospiria bacterium]|jgi:CBS domain-containing protein